MDYRVGVPVPGKYIEILNSDHPKYGGSGIYNPDVLEADRHLCDHREYSIPVKMPPLGVVIFKTTVG
jgi:1,4-alpha-glucan branching enzyme